MIYASSNLLKHECWHSLTRRCLDAAASKVPNSDSTGGQSLWSSNPSCASVEIRLVPIRRRDGQNWAELVHIGVDWWSTSPNRLAKNGRWLDKTGAISQPLTAKHFFTRCRGVSSDTGHRDAYFGGCHAMLTLKKWRIITLPRTTSIVDVDLRIAGNGIEGQKKLGLIFYCKIILKNHLVFFWVFHLKSWLRAEMSQPLEASGKMWRCCSYDDSTTSTSWRVRWVPHRSHAAPSRAGLTFRYRFDDPLEGHRKREAQENHWSKNSNKLQPRHYSTTKQCYNYLSSKSSQMDQIEETIFSMCFFLFLSFSLITGCQWSSWSQGKALEGLRGIEVPKPETWSPEEPHLHRLKVGNSGGSFGCFFLQAAGLVSEEFLYRLQPVDVLFQVSFFAATSAKQPVLRFGMGCTSSTSAPEGAALPFLLGGELQSFLHVKTLAEQDCGVDLGGHIDVEDQKERIIRMCRSLSSLQAPKAPGPGVSEDAEEESPLAEQNGVAQSPPIVDAPADQQCHLPMVQRKQSYLPCPVWCKADLQRWESELLGVSAELKQKLLDPHFVAQRCDLDSSGDLDVHELEQAVKVFGKRLATERLEELMRGQLRITKERFAEIVASLESSDSRRTVPHSLRGMALGQLQHLDALFVASGWLAAQCESFNVTNAQAIKEKTMFQQAPNLYAMENFVVTPMSSPGDCAARDHDLLQSVPQAQDKTSFSELVNAYGLFVHCFVSHYWGHLFSKTMRALRTWAEENYLKVHTEQPQSIVFWICLFALNQHVAAEEVGENPMQGPFNAALAQAECGAVLVLDEQVNPFKRIWCLFEVSRLQALNKSLEVICDTGSLSKSSNGCSSASREMLLRTCTELWKVSARRASCSVKDDKYRIFEEIINEDWKPAIAMLKKSLLQELERYELHDIFSEFDCYIQSLLSTSLLERLLVCGQFQEAAVCCLHGAQASEDAVDQICASFEANEQRRRWLDDMLVRSVEDESMVKSLLDRKASVTARRQSDGAPVLVLAAGHGLDSVVKLLLDHRADVAARKTREGITSLISAAQQGHASTVALLLDNGANCRATKMKGWGAGASALSLAAFNGHESVVKVLLDSTGVLYKLPVIFAAVGDRPGVLKLLLDYRAPVEERNSDGSTPLISAVFFRRTSALKFLLWSRANVEATRKDGANALSLAAGNEDVCATMLLLHYGADRSQVRDIHFRECDGCGAEPIKGCRFKCTECADCDFCQVCFDKKNQLLGGRCADHAFDRIQTPRLFLEQIMCRGLFEAIATQASEQGVEQIPNLIHRAYGDWHPRSSGSTVKKCQFNSIQ